MTPLQNWDNFSRGYTFGQPTWYSTHHLGLDIICPSWTPLYAPSGGTSVQANFTEGGNVINFSTGGLIMRFMHLAKISKTGQCNEGDIIGYTGNSGTLTTAPHLHVDISKGSVQVNNINNFINPETFNWKGGIMPWTPDEKLTVDRLISSVTALQGEVKAIKTQLASSTQVTGLSVEDTATLKWGTKLRQLLGIK